MLCISTNTVKGNFEEKLKSVSESNFNFVEIQSLDLLKFQNKTEEIFNKALSKKVNLLIALVRASLAAFTV